VRRGGLVVSVPDSESGGVGTSLGSGIIRPSRSVLGQGVLSLVSRKFKLFSRLDSIDWY
jgi:hypothetical protein